MLRIESHTRSNSRKQKTTPNVDNFGQSLAKTCNCSNMLKHVMIAMFYRDDSCGVTSAIFNPFMPTVAFNICCPRDCVSRHNGGTSGAPLKPLRDDSALRTLSSLRGLRGAPTVPPLCRETSVSQTANVGTVGKNGLNAHQHQ